MLAGQAVRMSPSSVSRTARALVAAGTTQNTWAACISAGTVSVSAWVGTSSRVAKQPSCTCWLRHISSSATGFTRAGSSKSATGGSLKAMCPFSPMPMQVMSTGKRRSSWE